MNRAVGLLVSRGWMNVCAFVSFIIVGRFLGPTEFGTYAVASAAVIFFVNLIGPGFSEHVISRDPERRDESAAFWCCVALGVAGTLVTAVAGVIVQHFSSAPKAGLLLYGLALLPTLWSLGVIQEATLVRDGRGGVIAAVLFIAESAGLVALLISLVCGWGVFSLVASRVVNNIIVGIGYTLKGGVRIFSPINRSSAHRMVVFSLGMMGTRIISWLDGYGSDLVLITLLPIASIGQFRMAFRLTAAPSSVLVQAATPAQLAYVGEHAARNPKVMGRTLLRALNLQATIAAPLMLLLAVCAQDIVYALLGPKWRMAGIILAVISSPVIFSIWPTLANLALITYGKSRRVLLIQIASTALGTIALAASAVWFGAIGAAASKVVVNGLVATTAFFLVPGLSSRARVKLFAATGRIVLATAACGLAAFLVGVVIHRPDALVFGLLRIALMGVAGLAAYALVLPFAAPSAWLQIKFLIERAMTQRKARRASIGHVAAAVSNSATIGQ